MTLCEYCLSFAGRFMKGNACCRVRQLAGILPEQRRIEFERVYRADGKEAANALIEAVNIERKRVNPATERRRVEAIGARAAPTSQSPIPARKLHRK